MVLDSFREFPANELRAGTDGRPGDWLRPHVRLVLCQSDALALCPMQGMPSISGTSGLAAVVVNGEPALGTMKGTQVVVNWSSSSPPEHWASGSPASGVENAAIAGAVAAATMKAPIMRCRRIANEDVAIPRV